MKPPFSRKLLASLSIIALCIGAFHLAGYLDGQPNLKSAVSFGFLAAMVFLSFFAPLFYFDPSEHLAATELPERARRLGWVGIWLPLLLALLFHFITEAAYYETAWFDYGGLDGLYTLVGGASIGSGIAPMITGACAYASGGRYRPGKVMNFYDPARSRKAGSIRLLAGTSLILWVLV